MTCEAVPSADAARLIDDRRERFLSDLVAYGLVSGVALCCDYGLLVALAAFGMPYLTAAALSFMAGMGVAYALSARFVFADRRAASQRREATGFVAVGLAGLLLTQALLYIFVSRFGLHLAVAKIPTTAAVFLFNFLGRRCLVFVKD